MSDDDTLGGEETEEASETVRRDSGENATELAGEGVDRVRAALRKRKAVSFSEAHQQKRGAGDVSTFDVDAINEYYAVILIGGRGMILVENFKIAGEAATPVAERIRFISQEAFVLWFANDLYFVGDKKLSAAHLWIRHPKRRQFRGIVFDPLSAPGGRDDGYYNLWRGFSVEPSPEGSCDIFLDHIRTNVAGGDERIYA